MLETRKRRGLAVVRGARTEPVRPTRSAGTRAGRGGTARRTGEWASLAETADTHIGAQRLQPGQVRLALLCALFGGCALVLVWRLFTFQVLDTTHYQELADQERHAEIPIIPMRGALL